MGKKIFLTFFLIIFSCNIFATQDDYVFDPLDSHHSIFIPDGLGRFPAILLLHPSSGIETMHYEWASILKNNGYVVYVVDSFKPRGWRDRSVIGWDNAAAAQLADIMPAYRYLSSLPYVDPNRIGILGFSLGGYNVLRVMERNASEDFQKLFFKAAASFYGVCSKLPAQMQIKGTTAIFIGEKDDRAQTSACLALIERSAGLGQPISMKMYVNALHGFDNFELPSSKEVIDERGEHYHVGYNAKARQSSVEDLIDFYNQYL